MKRKDILKTLAVCSVTLSLLTTEIGSTVSAVEPVITEKDRVEENQLVTEEKTSENKLEDTDTEKLSTEENTKKLTHRQQEKNVSVANVLEAITPPISKARQDEWVLNTDGIYVRYNSDENSFTYDLLTQLSVNYTGGLEVIKEETFFTIEAMDGTPMVDKIPYTEGTLLNFADFDLDPEEYYVQFTFKAGRNPFTVGVYVNLQTLKVKSIADKLINPGSISNTSSDATVVPDWIIRNEDGEEWKGSGNPTKEFLESLPNGKYTNTVTGNGETIYGNPLSDTTTNEFTIRRPKPVVEIGGKFENELGKKINPETIVGGLELDDSTGSWEIFDAAGKSVATGTDVTTISVPSDEGQYTVKITETSTEGIVAIAEDNFEIRYPKATVQADQAVNPTTITGGTKIIESTLTWEIRDLATGKVVLTGSGTDIPVPETNGKYSISVIETSPEGLENTATTEIEIRKPKAIVAVDREFNPKEIKAGYELPDSEFTWRIIDTVTGEEVSVGTGTAITPPTKEGSYKVSVTETSKEGLTSEATDLFIVRYPKATVEVDQAFNPETITATNKISDSIVTWEIIDEKGAVVDSGTGLDIPVPTEEGKYQVSVTETSPEGEENTAKTEFEIRYPAATVNVDKPFNPEKITATNKISDSTVTWEISDEKGAIINSGTGLDIPVPLEEGKYKVSVTETSPEGEVSQANTNFEIRHPKAEVTVDRAINPEKITGTHKIGDSEVYWVITDASGKAVASGVGTEIPVPENDGTYKVTFIEKSPEGEISSDTKAFEIRHPEATVTVDQVFNPKKITATNKILDSIVTWEITDETGAVIDSGTGLEIPVPEGEGRYKVSVTETSPEDEVSTASTNFEIRHPKAEVEVDKAVNPEKITGSQKISDSELTWEIKDNSGQVVNSGTGSEIPVPTDNGQYTVTVTETSPEGEVSTAETNFKIRHPKATAEVDKPINPGKLTAGQKLPDSTLTWEVRDFAGNVISTGTGATVEVPKDEGKYQLVTTETSLEGEVSVASVNFEVRYPEAEVNISKPINPDKITADQKIPESELTWEITDEAGNVLNTGSGKEIPVPTENGTYTVKVTEKSPEGEISVKDDTFVIRHPKASIEMDKPLNPDKITAGQTLPDSTLTWVITDKDGNVISSGTGSDIPIPTEDGSYTVTVTETSTEGETHVTTDVFDIKNNPIVPPIQPENPETNKLPSTQGAATATPKVALETKNTKAKLPQTSEVGNQSLLMGSVLSLAGIAFLLNKRNKKRQKE